MMMILAIAALAGLVLVQQELDKAHTWQEKIGGVVEGQQKLNSQLRSFFGGAAPGTPTPEAK